MFQRTSFFDPQPSVQLHMKLNRPTQILENEPMMLLFVGRLGDIVRVKVTIFFFLLSLNTHVSHVVFGEFLQCLFYL